MEYLMNGVEVLSKKEIIKKDFCLSVCIICVMIGMSSSIMLNDIILSLSIVYVGVFLGYILGFVFERKIPTGKYIYKVTISDEVNFNDFNNKYEIISQENKIYTIKEKDNK